MNRARLRGVSIYGATMQALELNLPGSTVSLDREPSAETACEFERQIGDGLVLAFRVALGVLRNREDAEDVAQEALLRAHGKFRRLRDPHNFRAWLARISFRLALDRVRARGRRERRETAWAAAQIEPTAEDIAAAGDFQRRLERALDELPSRLRLVLILAAIEGHGLKDVAALLAISEGTVKSRLFHARKRLAEKLEWIVNEPKRS